MRNTITGLAVLASLLLSIAACAPSVKVGANFDSDQDFASYKTFDWLKPGSGNADPMEKNPIIAKKVKRAIATALEAKGFEPAPGGGDFHIVFYGSTEDKLEVQSWTDPYYGWGYRGWAYGWGETRVTVDEYKEARLVIDIIDAKSKQLVYRAYGTGRVDDKPSDRHIDARIQRAVDKILADFPPK